MTNDTATEQTQKKSPNTQAGGDSAHTEKNSGGIKNTVPVLLKNKIEIYPNQPIPAYDNGVAKAYAASWEGNKAQNLFALICDPAFVPRTDSASLYKEFDNGSLPLLADRGVVYWPNAKQERYVLVYHDTLGKKLTHNFENPMACAMRPDDMIEIVLHPIIRALNELNRREFIHGAIRNDNIFLNNQSGTKQSAVLGDCLSAPAFSAQPVLYCTIHKGMSAPEGRGPGSRAEDMYALGVTLAILLRSHNPTEGMNDEDIVRFKMEHGSYTAIAGKERYKTQMLELLRGLLHDDDNERWTIDDLTIWMDGKRLTPKQSAKQKNAQRPINFNGKKYYNLPFLSMDLEKNPTETQRIIEDGELVQWVKRALSDEELIERIENAIIKSSQGSAKSTDSLSRLMAYLSLVMDNQAPIRYRGLKIMADGFGKAFAKAYILKHNVSNYIDLINNGVLTSWIAEQKNRNVDVNALLSRFESCRKYLMQNRIGYSLERCLYTLCPELHCLSDIFTGYFVQSPDQFIYAIEDMCKKGKPPPQFLDRHSIAFLSVHDAKLIDSFLFDLSSTKPHKQIMAELKCLARIQKLSSTGNLPHLCKAYLGNLEPLINRYHHKKTREKIVESIKQHAEKGNLIKIISTLDNKELQKHDLTQFRRAMALYTNISTEAKILDAKLERKEKFEILKAMKIAAGASVFAAFLMVIFLTLLSKSNTNIF